MDATLQTLASLTTLAAGGGGQAEITILLIIALGVGAQWLAWRIGLPSILLLLLFGFIAGPGWKVLFGEPLIDPDPLLGDALLPLVGVSVGLILYEGGLTLRFKEITNVRKTVVLLVTVGAAVTGILAALIAKLVLDVSTPIAFLFGSVLIVTGPTVVGPLLHHIRPAGSVGPILKWEGIVIDPVGALTAVLVLEVILTGAGLQASADVAWAITKTIVAGGGLGLAGAAILMLFMSRFWIPEQLQNPISLMLVVVTFILSNKVQEESGLLATTVMGVILANQSRIEIRHILEFKENLRVLLISILFIILAARVQADALASLNWLRVIAFLILLIVIVRPASVFASTIGQGLSLRERIFLCFMAPRGIVAAAVASVFALALENAVAEGRIEVTGAESLVPLTFSVIVGTVLFYGLTSSPVARLLGVSDQNPQGFVIVGASRFARAIAGALRKHKVAVKLIDTNRGNVTAARMDNLEAMYGNVLDENFFEDLDLRGIGRAIALTPNDEVNTLALQRFERTFGKAEIYTLPSRAKRKKTDEASPLRPAESDAKKKTTRKASEHGRALFAEDLDLGTLEKRFVGGWIVKTTTLTDEFGVDQYHQLYGPAALTLFIISDDGEVQVSTGSRPLTPSKGDTVIALVDPDSLLMGMIQKKKTGDTSIADVTPPNNG